MFFIWLLIYGTVMLLFRYFAPWAPWAIPVGLLISTSALISWLLVQQKGTLVCFKKIPLSHWKHHLFFLPYLLPILSNLLFFGFRLQSALTILSIFLAVILEEVIFRDILLKFLCRRNYIWGIVLSAVLFAAAHLLNFEHGIAPVYLVHQVAFALAAGFAFAGITLSCETLLPCIGIHFLINITASDAFALPGKYQFVLWLCIAVYLACGMRSICILRNSTKKGHPHETLH